MRFVRGRPRSDLFHLRCNVTKLDATALATPVEISQIVGDVLDFLARENVDARATHHAALVIEEVLSNLGTHGGCRDKPARITVSIEPSRVRGEIIDRGPPFDPRDARASGAAALGEPEAGGFGLRLVRHFSTVEYAYRNGENCMTFFVNRAAH